MVIYKDYKNNSSFFLLQYHQHDADKPWQPNFHMNFYSVKHHLPMSHLSFHTKSFNWNRILMKFRFLFTYRQRGGVKQFIPSAHMVTVLQLYYLYPFKILVYEWDTWFKKTVAINSDFENVLNCVRNMTASGIVRKLKLDMCYFSAMDFSDGNHTHEQRRERFTFN